MNYKHYNIYEYPKLYLDYVNNFLTTDKFAEHYNMNPEQAVEISVLGHQTDNFTDTYSWVEDSPEQLRQMDRYRERMQKSIGRLDLTQ
jgi:hypothetical protein